MPLYDYMCDDCGAFTAFAALADYAQPSDCPACSEPAPRVLINTPRLAVMASGTRRAHETNERSADSPKRSKHGPGCGCCSGGATKRSSKTLHHADGSKSFPTKRPWMISH